MRHLLSNQAADATQHHSFHTRTQSSAVTTISKPDNTPQNPSPTYLTPYLVDMPPPYHKQNRSCDHHRDEAVPHINRRNLHPHTQQRMKTSPPRKNEGTRPSAAQIHALGRVASVANTLDRCTPFSPSLAPQPPRTPCRRSPEKNVPGSVVCARRCLCLTLRIHPSFLEGWHSVGGGMFLWLRC